MIKYKSCYNIMDLFCDVNTYNVKYALIDVSSVLFRE